MIRFLLFFTIAVSMASAVLAYLTKEKATELSDKLSSSTQMVGTLKTENGKLKEEKKTVASQVETLNGSSQQQKEDLDKARAATISREGELAKIKSDLQTAQGKVVDLEKKLAEKPAPVAAPIVDPAMEQMVANLKVDLEKARQSASEENDKASKKIHEMEAKMAQMVSKPVVPSEKEAQGKQPLTGEVVAYNEGWNFVVVSLGDKQGVTPESKLMIQRGGKMIAQLQITDVQPKFSTAGINYAPKISSKERVRPGDTVMFVPKVEVGPEAERSGFNVSNLFPKISPGAAQ
jgi:hypothetical protein